MVRPRSSSAAFGLSVVAGGALLAGLWLLEDQRSTIDREPDAPSARRYALSPQECTTECQSRQTDCILECDGKVPCERRCTEVGRACVERCRRADAGAGGSGGGGAAGGTGTAGTAPAP